MRDFYCPHCKIKETVIYGEPTPYCDKCSRQMDHLVPGMAIKRPCDERENPFLPGQPHTPLNKA